MKHWLLSLTALGCCLAWPAAALASAPPSLAEIEGALRSNNAEQLAQTLKKLQQATSGDRFELSFHKGLIQLKREQLEAAMASFAVIPASSPYYLDARNNMAAIYAAQGKFAEAKSTLEESLKTNQTLELMHKNLNNLKAHLASKNYASALQILDAGKSSKLSLVVSTGVAPSEPLRTAASAQGASAKPVAEAAADKTAKASEPVAAKPVTAASAALLLPAAAPAAAPAPAATPAPAQSATVVAQAPKASAKAADKMPEKAVDKAADKASEKAKDKAETATPEAESTKAALQALRDWAQAWERKDMARYFKAYAPEFTPPEGKTRAQWAKEREAKILSKGSIHIQLKHIEATPVGKTQMKLRYRQLYQADQLKIASDKTVEMKWDGQHWLITSERAMEGARK